MQEVTSPLLSTADLLTPLDSFDLEPSGLLSPSILSTAYMLRATSTRSFGSAYLSSSSISKSPDPEQESGIGISPEEIGGIVVAALAVITALVILLTVSAYVYWRKVLKKRKGKYKYSERLDSQAAAVVSYDLTKNAVVVSYEELTESMTAKGSPNKCTNCNSIDTSHRMSFRNRGVSFHKSHCDCKVMLFPLLQYSEANAYSLFDKEVKVCMVYTEHLLAFHKRIACLLYANTAVY